jgi:S1-C subfamily serine protease
MKLKNIGFSAALLVLHEAIAGFAGGTNAAPVAGAPAPAVAAATADMEVVGAVSKADPIPSNSVVRIMGLTPVFDPMTPWATLPPQEFTSSGCVLAGRRILTTAHGLRRDAGVLRVQRPDGGTSTFAVVERLNPVIDLAVLKVEKEEFFDGLVPLGLAPDDLPSNGAPVRAIGFPNGALAPSAGNGAVIDLALNENIPARVTPMLKVAAAGMAPGSSGSPVILDDNLITGILASGNSNEIFAVPAGVIRAFLAKQRPEDAGAACRLGIGFQNIINPAMRAWKRLKPGQTGQLVTKVSQTGPAFGKLMAGDVLTSVDGMPIGDDGSMVLPGGRRVDCRYQFNLKFGGDTLRFAVIRDGKPMEVIVPAAPADRDAVPTPSSRPAFYMHAGLVFMPLTRDLTRYLCSGATTERELHIFASSILRTGDDASVVVSRVLPDEIMKNCEPVAGECVRTIDGQETRDLEAIRRTIESGKDPFIVIVFQSGTALALDRVEARAATARIMRRLEMPINYANDP